MSRFKIISGSVIVLAVAGAVVFVAAPLGRKEQSAAPEVLPARAAAGNLADSARPAVGSGVAGPRLVAEQMELDLGRVPVGKSVLHEFRFANRGTGVLEIASVGASCGCTVVGDWTRRVEAGGNGGVVMNFTVPEVDGLFHKTLNVASNDPAAPTTVFAIKGVGWRLFKAEPPSVAFARTEGGPPGKEVKVRLVNQSDAPVELNGARSVLAGLEATLAEKAKGREYELTLVPKEGSFSVGSGQVVIGCSSKEVPQVTVPVVVAILPGITLSPAQVVLPPGPAAEAASHKVMIRANGPTPLGPPEVLAKPDGTEAKVSEVQKGVLYELEIGLPKGWQPPEGRPALVVIKTAHPNYPRIEVPLLSGRAGEPVARPAEVAAVPGPSGAAVRLGFDKTTHDLGEVPAGAAYGHDFGFTVPADAGGEVEIVRVDACSNKGRVRDWTRRVAPGGKGNVSLALDTSGLDGPVEVAFLVMAANSAAPIAELRLKVLVRQSVGGQGASHRQ